MKAETKPTIDGNEGFENGLNVEHFLLSVTIVSTEDSGGQFDDSCTYQLRKAMMKYDGIKSVRADVLHSHTKIEQHSNDCQCGQCTYVNEP